MNLIRALTFPYRNKPWVPRHLRLITADLFSPGGSEPRDPAIHLAAALEWLCRAQDIRNDRSDAGGVSAGWSFEDGWLPSYPETSGYIVETFLAGNGYVKGLNLRTRAGRIIDWELSLQHSDGAFPGHFGEPGSHPVIFNTGQIMHGMIAGHAALGRNECLDAAVKAGHWLARHQDADGAWRKFEHNGVPHVYNTRGTWALAATAILSGDAHLRQVALRNLEWALSQQRPSGWFATNAFTPDRAPFTHTIAYAIRGFIECGVLFGEERYIEAATNAATALMKVQRRDGWLAGTYDERWNPAASYCCLTGVAQMSINWSRLAQVSGQSEFREAARRALDYLKRRHRISDRDPAVRGGIAGSFPIWGRYSMFEYPNWAAKFFADALMIDMENIEIPPIRKIAERQVPKGSTGERASTA